MSYRVGWILINNKLITVKDWLTLGLVEINLMPLVIKVNGGRNYKGRLWSEDIMNIDWQRYKWETNKLIQTINSLALKWSKKIIRT